MLRAMQGISRRGTVGALTLLLAWRAYAAPAPPVEPLSPPAVDAHPSQADQARSNARDLYARLRITFVGKDALQDNQPLRGARFYETVDRPDLAARYRELDARKNLVAAFATVALGAGVVWGAVDLTIAKTDARAHRSPTLIPWGIAIVGLAGLVVSAALPLDPVPESERQALARERNRKTAARLGADPE